MQEVKNNTKFARRLFFRLIFIGFLLLLFAVFLICVRVLSLGEQLSRAVSEPIVRGVGSLTSRLPFSVFEVLVCVVIAAIFYFIIKLIVCLVRKQGKRLINLVSRYVVVVLAFLVFYNAAMGFAYYRPSPNFGVGEYSVSDEAAETAMLEMIDELYSLARAFSDENGEINCPYTFDELYEKIAIEYRKVDGYFYSFTPRVKPIQFSFVMSFVGISGIYFAPTGEANINMLYLNTYYMPHVIAHELAHAKGVNRESDAEEVARYILLSSSDPYLRYAGLLNSYGLIRSALILREDYREILENEPVGIRKEYDRIYDMQERFTNPLETLFDKINSWYINRNNQEKGTDEYVPDYGEIEIKPPDGGTGGGDDDDETDPEEPEYRIELSKTQKMIVLVHLDTKKA